MIEKFEVPYFDNTELQTKLASIRWPNEYEDNSVNWTCGAPTWAVKDMVDAWKKFNWNKTLMEISSWNHYRTKVDDLMIHFVHERSSKENAIPIVLLHGWPSTFYEFHKLIEPLRDNPTQAFHVVVPSLPGYAFSDAPKSPGFAIPQYASLLNKLMIEIGYDKYMIFGTDWGATIGSHMAKVHATNVIGFLTTMPSAYPPLPTLQNILSHPIKVLLFILALLVGWETVYGKKETQGLATTAYADADKCENAGYRAIQSTRPYTLAYGLSDSPVGLLGWMLEKYHEWTFLEQSEMNTSTLPHTMTVDEFLTQVTLYWMTNTMSSSYRIYYEVKQDMNTLIASMKLKMTVPFAISYFENEITKIPRDWFEASSDHLVQFKYHDKGGHFAALEEPELLKNDIIQFASKLNLKTTSQNKKND